MICSLELTEEQRKRLIIPPRDPPKLNNRRKATLVVTPASLIGQWLSQIDQHIDDKVNLKIIVHHGQCKALLGTELQENDIVISTYGTLQAEYGQPGPLLRAKWLRVILDEGHYIKNHNSQTAKACDGLDTRRKWIVSGKDNIFQSTIFYIQTVLGLSLLCYSKIERSTSSHV